MIRSKPYRKTEVMDAAFSDRRLIIFTTAQSSTLPASFRLIHVADGRSATTLFRPRYWVSAGRRGAEWRGLARPLPPNGRPAFPFEPSICLSSFATTTATGRPFPTSYDMPEPRRDRLYARHWPLLVIDIETTGTPRGATPREAPQLRSEL